MSKWIDQERQKRNEEKQRQERYASAYPTLAETLWGQVCNTIRDDFQRVQKEFPELVTEKTQIALDPHSLQIDHDDLFPHYQLRLMVSISEQRLTMHRHRLDSPGAQVRGVEGPEQNTTFLLSLDEEMHSVQILREGKVLPLEQFSELCLRPIIDLHPVDVFRIVSDRIVSL
jgi:hypothetical protein